jgi:transcriptional regulator with XRE-family HTH domain
MATTLSDALRDKIRTVLRAQRWTQREFARRLGVTQGAISYLLAGKRRRDTLEAYADVADVLGVSLSTLIADLEQRVGATDPPRGDRFLVAELSKNWIGGLEVMPGSGLIAQQFERVLAHHHARGYRLLTFQLHRLMTQPDELNETILAVFERHADLTPSRQVFDTLR